MHINYGLTDPPEWEDNGYIIPQVHSSSFYFAWFNNVLCYDLVACLYKTWLRNCCNCYYSDSGATVGTVSTV
jgi:hypothetical protein